VAKKSGCGVRRFRNVLKKFALPVELRQQVVPRTTTLLNRSRAETEDTFMYFVSDSPAEPETK